MCVAGSPPRTTRIGSSCSWTRSSPWRTSGWWQPGRPYSGWGSPRRWRTSRPSNPSSAITRWGQTTCDVYWLSMSRTAPRGATSRRCVTCGTSPACGTWGRASSARTSTPGQAGRASPTASWTGSDQPSDVTNNQQEKNPLGSRLGCQYNDLETIKDLVNKNSPKAIICNSGHFS